MAFKNSNIDGIKVANCWVQQQTVLSYSALKQDSLFTHVHSFDQLFSWEISDLKKIFYLRSILRNQLRRNLPC